jgi:hypothetical protein
MASRSRRSDTIWLVSCRIRDRLPSFMVLSPLQSTDLILIKTRESAADGFLASSAAQDSAPKFGK